MFLGVPFMIDLMQKRTLAAVGEMVAARRLELVPPMGQAELARTADVDPKTVRSLERGERWPRDTSRAQIETALQWMPGSLDEMLEGGDPTPAPQTIRGVGVTPGAAHLQVTGGTPGVSITPERRQASFGLNLTPSIRMEGAARENQGAWHVVGHVWDLVDKVIENLARSNPSRELVDNVRQLVTVFGRYVAEPMMNANTSQEDRDRALAELYRRRDRSDRQLAALTVSPDESEPGSVAGIESAITGVTIELQVEDGDERSEKPG